MRPTFQQQHQRKLMQSDNQRYRCACGGVLLPGGEPGEDKFVVCSWCGCEVDRPLLKDALKAIKAAVKKYRKANGGRRLKQGELKDSLLGQADA